MDWRRCGLRALLRGVCVCVWAAAIVMSVCGVMDGREERVGKRTRVKKNKITGSGSGDISRVTSRSIYNLCVKYIQGDTR